MISTHSSSSNNKLSQVDELQLRSSRAECVRAHVLGVKIFSADLQRADLYTLVQQNIKYTTLWELRVSGLTGDLNDSIILGLFKTNQLVKYATFSSTVQT